mmetsp:Transcript_8971/g.26112  ORF Transcript_8971/g.26112 Transcript_8971/m.26112 type:complete len:256 (+) Transcript_8971:100-867(+)
MGASSQVSRAPRSRHALKGRRVGEAVPHRLIHRRLRCTLRRARRVHGDRDLRAPSHAPLARLCDAQRRDVCAVHLAPKGAVAREVGGADLGAGMVDEVGPVEARARVVVRVDHLVRHRVWHLPGLLRRPLLAHDDGAGVGHEAARGRRLARLRVWAAHARDGHIPPKLLQRLTELGHAWAVLERTLDRRHAAFVLFAAAVASRRRGGSGRHVPAARAVECTELSASPSSREAACLEQPPVSLLVLSSRQSATSRP